MSERTPNTNTIRHAWAKGHPFPLTTDVDERYAEFDRWLAAHDAEVCASVVAEEPDWEYGACYQADNGRELLWFSMGNSGFAVREAAEKEVERYADAQTQLRRRHKAGPWVPVEQEGAET